MRITGKKTIAAVIAGAFIMVGVAMPYAVQAAEKTNERPAHHQRQVDPAKAADHIANTYKVSKLSVLKYNAGGKSFRYINHAAFLAYASGKSLDEVMSLKTDDNNWKTVAADLGLTKDQMRTARNTIFADRMQSKFGIDSQTTSDLLKEGYKHRHIAMAGLLAQKANKPVTDVVKMKTVTNNWSDVAKILGVDRPQ